MTYKKHLTIYGGALGDSPDAGLLAKYDTLIVSPSTYRQLPPSLRPRAGVYWTPFSSPRYHRVPGDWQPSPGDMGMLERTKAKGGRSWIYQMSDEWRGMFIGSMFAWAQKHRGQFARIFLEDIQKSHSWWDDPVGTVPDWRELTQHGEIAETLRMIEDMAGWIGQHLGSTKERGVIALSGHPEDLSYSSTGWYCESFGAGWQPIDLVRARARQGMFIQVNTSDERIRKEAVKLALEVGGSVGMQPHEGVLSYNEVEDPDTWPE